MSLKRSALGKGLGALISDANEINAKGRWEYEHSDAAQHPEERAPLSEQVASPTSISDIPVDKIVTNPFQPRTTFDETALDELAESIKLLGLIQPVTVRCIGSQYQIISGERRFRAAKRAGLTHIPAYIRKADDQGMLEMAIVENIQREDLDAIEVAISFQRLIEECHLTQEAMAERVGKKRTTVTNYLRLLKLPPEIQSSLRTGKISIGHAKCILSLEKPEDQVKLCEQIMKKDLSVRQAEAKVKDFAKAKTSEPSEEAKVVELPEPYYRVLEIIGKFFDNNISLKRSEKGKGSITIQFDSDSEVEDFLKAIENHNL